jgi:hypothetical protein
MTTGTDIPHDQLEAVARALCELRVGDKGRYDRKGCKRSHWRQRARTYINRAHAISTADALMAVFGFRRVGA